MERIDRDVERLVNEFSNRVGGDAPSPANRDYAQAEEYARSSQYDKRPRSDNPATEELSYQISAADRDVAARLEQFQAIPSDAQVLTLAEALRVSQVTGREYLNAEEDYLLTAIRLLIERHRWGPRFFNDLSAFVDGSFDQDKPVALSLINELRATQRLPYGGEVEARLVWQAAQQLRDSVSEGYEQSTQLILTGDIPLLRNAGLIAQEDLIQAERDLVYAARDFEAFRRDFFVSIATDYFDLAAQRASLDNLTRSLDGRRKALERAIARVEAGKDPASAARSFEQDVLRAIGELNSQRERYILSLDRFKIRLGVSIETPIEIQPVDIDLYDPDTTPAQAAQLALNYRLDLQNNRDRIDDARRAVANAHNQLLPDLDLFASLTTSTPEDDRVGRFDLRPGDSDYRFGVTFGLPLDREIERLSLRSAVIGLQRQIRSYEQFRDNVILDARAARRQIEQQRLALRLAEERVEANRLRVEELVLKEANALDIRDAQDDLLEAENARDDSLRALRVAILEYLRAAGILRVKDNGDFQPLPGMPNYVPATASAPASPEPAPEPHGQPGEPAPTPSPAPIP